MSQKYSSFIVLAIFILIVLGVPIWDKLSPMPGCGEVIQQMYGDQYAWCVAFTYSSSSKETNRERVYVLFPKVFSDASVVSIRSSNEDNPIVSQRNYGALFTAFVYGGIYVSYWKLMQQRGSKINSRKENTDDVQMK